MSGKKNPLNVTPSRSNLIELVHHCNSMEELMYMWKNLTEAEQKCLKQFFAERKEKLSKK